MALDCSRAASRLCAETACFSRQRRAPASRMQGTDKGPNNSGPNQGGRDECAHSGRDEGADEGPDQVRARLATAPPSL